MTGHGLNSAGQALRAYGLAILVVLISAIFTVDGAAAPPALRGMPGDTRILGNAYVKAWRTLRFDIDTLHYGDTHPAIIHEWLRRSSDELLWDFIRHGQDSTLVILAARALAQRNAVTPKTMNRVQRQWKHSPLQAQFLALRVLGNDVSYIRKLESRLTEPSDSIRISAAEVLALAKHRSGINAVRTELARCGPQVRRAAHVLARMGGGTEQKWLEQGIRAGCEPNLLQAASGEILFRKWYPFHYELLTRRDASETRYRVDDGMYRSWFRIVRHADAQGIHETEAFQTFVKHFREFDILWPNEDAQLVKRNLDALVAFFESAAPLLRHPSVPSWPTSFTAAEKALQDTSAEGLEKRVSAAIALISELGTRLNIQQLNRSAGFHLLSPRGARTVDGNWRTSWQGNVGDELTLEWSAPVNLTAIQLAGGCIQTSGGEIHTVQVTVVSKNVDHKNDKSDVATFPASLQKNVAFYQQIDARFDDVVRVSVKLQKLWGPGPACVPEMRVVTK